MRVRGVRGLLWRLEGPRSPASPLAAVRRGDPAGRVPSFADHRRALTQAV